MAPKFCPNLNLPESKALINKLGLLGFYKEYIKNGYNIPSLDATKAIIGQVDALPKAVDVISKNIQKLNQWYSNKAMTKDIFWKKVQELGVPKNQVEILSNIEGESLDEILLTFVAENSYGVEIKTTTRPVIKVYSEANEDYFDYNGSRYERTAEFDREGRVFSHYRYWRDIISDIESYDYQTDPVEITKEEYDKIRQESKLDDETVSTDYYKNLTVPGGTNYTENEISIPNIVPSIKGHAQFATDNGIGWFRSDDKTILGKIDKTTIAASEAFDLEPKAIKRIPTKTRRILEVQSDLFQKGRDKRFIVKTQLDEDIRSQYGEDYVNQITDEYRASRGNEGLKENNFLQLLNKDNNWVTFFVKSIIQDSVNKNYEKVLFPTGDTASKIEGHETLEGFIKEKQDRIDALVKRNKDLEEGAEKPDGRYRTELKGYYSLDKTVTHGNKEAFISISKEEIELSNKEIVQLQEEIKRVETEGFGALKPIWTFYENNVANILKKQGYNPTVVTDEYGNKWNEVTLNSSNKNTIYFDINPNSLVIDQLFVDIDTFSIKQQNEIIDTIIYQIDQAKQEGITNVDSIFDYVRELFQNQAEEIVADNNDGSLDEWVKLYNSIDTNWDKFVKFSKDKLVRLGVKISKNKLIETENTESNEDVAPLQEVVPEDPNADVDEFVMSEADYQRDNYDDGFIFSQSSKDTASAHLKLKLSNIPEVEYVDGELQPKENFLGMNSYMSLDKVWNTLLRELTPLEIDQIYPRLEELAAENPMYAEIINQIFSDPNVAIQNEFLVTFSQQQAKFVTALIRNTDKAGNTTLSVFGTNRKNAEAIIIEDWMDRFKRSVLVSDETGDLVINQELAKKVLEKYNKLISDKVTVTQLQNFLSGIGITMSEQALQNLVQYGVGSKDHRTFKTFLEKELVLVFKRLAGDFVETGTDILFDYNNPFISESKTITALAKLELNANPALYEASFVSGDGKSKYSYVKNSYLSKLFKKFKGDRGIKLMEDLSTTSYASSSVWVKKYLNNPKFAEVFDLEYFDTLGTEQSKQKGKLFKQMSTKEKEFVRLALFQNQGREGIAKFFGLIPSDKTTLPVITALKTNVVITENGLGKEALADLYTGFVSEYNRISDVIAQENDPSVEKIVGYHNGMGKKFLIYDFLNGDKELFNEDGSLRNIDPATLKTIVTPKINKFIRQSTTNQLKAWKALGIFDRANDKYVSNPFDKGYRKLLGNFTTEEEYQIALAADYVVNSFIANMNYTQVIGGDPALHGKKTIEATWINYSKRLAKDIAPGLDGNFVKPTYDVLFLKDVNYSSKHLAEYMDVIGAKAAAYGNITTTDAQEYTTLKEHLAVMDAYGKLSPELKAAGERLLAGGELSSDMELILQPMKPVQVGFKIDKELGINRAYYIKTSSFPLIPSLTRGLAIDELRVRMEADNTDRAVYESGVKLGLSGDIGNTVVTLDRDIFRLQQEIPYHGKEDYANEGSQGRKLLLVDVKDDEELTLTGFEGPVSGKDAKTLYEALHVEKMNRAFDKFLVDVGATKENNILKINDLSKLQKVLLDEATSRGYNVNDIYGLQIETVEGRQRFKIPLGFNTSSSRLESILNALVTNRVIKQELPGFAKVQGSGYGFSKVATLEETSEFIKDSITWVDPSDTELNYIRKSEDGKTLLQADILVPSWFKNESGELIDVSTFVKEDGTLDTDRIPEELLTIIGIRIPTQGLNSMMSFRVKGFLPKLVGDLAIVPAEVVTQMGSDFDVDKLFIYRYEYELNNGKYSKIQPSYKVSVKKLKDKQINNAIVQFYEDRYKDVRLLSKMLEPNGFGQLPELAKEVAYKLELNNSGHYFLPSTQNQIHKNNNDGKAGTGIFSLFSTFIKAAQDAYLELEIPIVFTVEDNKVVTESRLYTEGLTQSPSTTVSYFQSASVDNAKEQLLGTLNINGVTMDVAGVIALTGFDENYIAKFLSQPIIREYVELANNINDITNPVFNSSKELAVQLQLLAKYGSPVNDNKSLSIELGIPKIGLSLEAMGEQLSNPTAEVQTNILLQFLQIKNSAKQIRQLQSAINTDTNGLGARFTNLQVKQDQIELAQTSSSIKNANRLFNGSTIVGKASQILKDSLQLYSSILPYESNQYKQLTNTILQEQGKADKEINVKDLDSIYSNIKSLIMSDSYLLDLTNITTVREGLLFNTKGNKSLGDRWLDYISSPAGKKNLLAERIKVRRGTTKIDPVMLEAVNTPAAVKEDTNAAIADFYRMYYRGSELEKELALDIVRYYILTGASSGLNSIGKYIPYDILEDYDFSSKLNDINDDLQTSDYSLFNGVTQYFQHNPSKAIPFTEENVISNEYENGILDKFEIQKGSQYEIVTFDKDRNKKLYKYPDYMSVYSRDSKEFLLFKIQKSDNNKATYTRIDTLGDTNLLEYNVNGNQYSLIAKNQAGNQIPAGQNQVTATTEDADYTVVKTINNYKTLADVINLESSNLEDMLNTIIENPQTPEYSNIAKDLKKALKGKKVTVLPFDKSGASGQYDSSTKILNINLNAILKGGSDTALQEAQKVLIHETLHVLTVNKIINYSILPKEEKAKVDAIRSLFDKYRDSLDSEELSRYELIVEDIKDGKSISEEDRIFLRDNKTKYYPLISLEEFIAAGLTDEAFVQELKKNNFWESVWGLWNAVMDLLGLSREFSNDYEALYNTSLNLGGLDNTVNEFYQEMVEAKKQEKPKTYKGNINSLTENQIFVFGSNPEGRHGAGAAKVARDKFGAKYGQGEGLQGKSYALPTKDLRITENSGYRSISEAQIIKNIKKLYDVARENPNKEFLVAYSSEGRNLNGYTSQEMANMFAANEIPNNIVFEEGFNKLVRKVNLDIDFDAITRRQFVLQKAEFLTKYRKKIGDRITDQTLKEIKESAEAKEKYSLLNIWSWNGELRVSYKAPIYLDIAPEQRVPTAEEQFIEITLKRLKALRGKLKSSPKYKSDPIIQNKVASLTAQIKEITNNGTAAGIISDIKDKLDNIQERLDNPGLINVLDVEESERYLSFYQNIKEYISFSEAFESLNKDLDYITRRSKELIPQLKAKAAELLYSELKQRIRIQGVNIEELLTSPTKDVGRMESLVQSGAFSSSQIIQLLQELVNDTQIKTNEEFTEIEHAITELVTAYLKKYKNYDMLLQLDSDGKPTGRLLNKYAQGYYDKLNSLKGKKKAYAKFFKENTKVELTEEGKALWEKDLADIKATYPNWDVDNTFDNNEYLLFLFGNDPNSYVKLVSQGKSTKGIEGAKKYVSERPIDKWLDPSYQKLKSLPENDPARLLYDLLDAEFRSLNRKYGNQVNYIPELSKSLVGHMLQGNWKGGFGAIKESITNSLYKTIEPVSVTDVDINGKPHDTIPVYMMSDFLSPEEKSYDLGRVLLSVKAQETALAHKAEVEPLMLIMKQIIQDLPQYNINESGIIQEQDGVPSLDKTSVGRNKNLNDQANWIIEDFLYDKGTKQSNFSRTNKITKTRTNTRGEEVTVEKVLAGSKVADTVGAITRLKGMGLNPFSGFGNLVFGIISNAIYSGDRKAFGEGESIKAFGIMLQAAVPKSVMNKKVDRLMKYFDVLKQTTEIKYGQFDLKSPENPLVNLSWYEFQKRGEYFVQGQTAMAMILNKKIKNKAGKTVTYFDAFDNEGKWKSEFGENPFNNYHTKLDFIHEIGITIANVHGDYANGLKAKEHWIGRALLIFRTWLPQSIASRFGAEYKDLRGNTIKGRYLSLNAEHALILPLIRDMYTAFNTSVENDTVDTRNMRKNAIELAFIPVLWAAGMFLKSLIKSDDDDEDEALLTFMLNSTLKASNDLTFFMNPYSMKAVMKEPIPAMKTLMDAVDLLPAVINAVGGEDTYKTGRRKGKSKLYKELVEIFPIVNQPEKLATATSEIFDRD